MKQALFLILMLAAPVVSSELLPEKVTESELAREVNWCGVLRTTVRYEEKVWFIYDSLALRGAAHSIESCKKLYENPNRFSSGAFVLQRAASSVPDWMFNSFSQPPTTSGCQLLGFHSGVIKGFVEYEGISLPYIETLDYPQHCTTLQNK